MFDRAKAFMASRLTGEYTMELFYQDFFRLGIGACVGGMIVSALLFTGVL